MKKFLSLPKLPNLSNHLDKLRGSIYARAIIYAFYSFLFLRLLASIIPLIGIIQPRPDYPYSEFTQNQVEIVEQRSSFSKFFLAPWYRWDTSHYIEIAEYGYDFDHILSVWPPLYPFLIKLLSYLVEPTILSALIISNFFFFLGLLFLYLLVQKTHNEEVAKRTLFYTVIFPTSFFFIAGYTESIFLFLSVLVFLLLRKKKWLWAGFISALAALTRVQGLLLVIPIFIEISNEYLAKRNWKSFLIHLLSCSLAPFAYGLYSLYVFFGLRVDWPWVTLSKEWDQHFSWPWQGIISFINFISRNELKSDITPILIRILSIILPIFVIFILYRLRKKIPLSMSAYSWAMLVLIMGKIDNNNFFVSTIRYLIVIFPFFVGQANFLSKKIFNMIYFAFSLIILILLIAYFYWWVWVA